MQDLHLFFEWLKKVGVEWNQELMEVCYAPANGAGRGWGVFAKKDLKEGDRLCLIPKKAILSTVTSPISDIIEQERLGGGLGLTLAVAVEKVKGNASFWWASTACFLRECEYLNCSSVSGCMF